MKTVNLIGAGLIGQERLKAVAKLRDRGLPVQVGAVFDPFQPQLEKLAATYGFQIEAQLERLLARPADLLIVACPHDVATEQTCLALNAGHRVLLEKPVGRDLGETERIALAAKNGRGLYVGLNYRFMPGINSLITDWRAKCFGEPISLHLQMGHGGRPGDEKTWKLDPVRCGGGALLDPGIHLLDLVLVMTQTAPEIATITSWRGFWNTGIEEDVRILLQSGPVQVGVDVSVVRWRSSFEIFALGTDGYGQVTGRGRSYGRQYYRRGRRWGWQTAKDQASSEEMVVDDACEDSFADELGSLLQLSGTGAAQCASLSDGLAVMQLYQSLKARLA